MLAGTLEQLADDCGLTMNDVAEALRTLPRADGGLLKHVRLGSRPAGDSVRRSSRENGDHDPVDTSGEGTGFLSRPRTPTHSGQHPAAPPEVFVAGVHSPVSSPRRANNRHDRSASVSPTRRSTCCGTPRSHAPPASARELAADLPGVPVIDAAELTDPGARTSCPDCGATARRFQAPDQLAAGQSGSRTRAAS
jgi:hypothetical protein